MKKVFCILLPIILFISCSNDDYKPVSYNNPEIALNIPAGFPALNNAVLENPPTLYGTALGKMLFTDKRFSADNTISCADCHIQALAFSDNNARGIGIKGRVGLRNVPPLQNLAFMNFYNWDGSKLQLEKQSLVPIITHEEMDSSILDIIGKIKDDATYKELFNKAFGDEGITPERIYKSIAQYEYTLLSANSKYDKVMRNEGEDFTVSEASGYEVFRQKCVSCHSTALFTDQSFRNIGFPLNQDTNEAGRARVTGISADYMSFRVPSLRNVAITAPYGSFGQFATLKSVLDYFSDGVLDADNLDPVFKNNSGKIPLTETEKVNLIAFMKTLTDDSFISD